MVCYCARSGWATAGWPAGASADRLRGRRGRDRPIALGYHFAHYLTAFLVDVQYAAITFSDPSGGDGICLASAMPT